MRTSVAVACGIAIGAFGTAIGWLAVERLGAPSSTADIVARVQPDVPLQAARDSAPAVPSPPGTITPTLPSTPVYGARPPHVLPRGVAPRSSSPIYRCRLNGVTTYSNQPCIGATVVDDSSAVAGYDSRPSANLARLVADGRTADPDGGSTSSVGRPARHDDESPACANMRRQIRDLDAEALWPRSRAQQDELRRQRQDIRSGMARSHC